MEIAVFSWPESLPEEIHKVETLFRAGLSTFHLRKPGWTFEENQQFLHNLTPHYLDRIILHQHFSLSLQFGLKGIHFSKRYPINDNLDWLKTPNLIKSTAIHDLAAFKDLPEGIQRVFISPVFESISKSQHPGQFSMAELGEFLKQNHNKAYFFALGGIYSNNIYQIQTLGFHGAGILGTIWRNLATSGKDTTLTNYQEIIRVAENSGYYESN